MKRNLPKRYITEDMVKKALKIDSFRNLSKDKVMQFMSMIPYMDKDVAIAIINQFPAFADFGKVAVQYLTEAYNNILEKNNESQREVLQGYQKILDALAAKLNADNISENERKSITEDMISIADKIAEADMRNKKFLIQVLSRVLFGIFAVVGCVSAGMGIKSTMESGNAIPQIGDEDTIE